MTQDNHIPPAILEEAIDWFLQLQGRPDCPEVTDGFQIWLARSPLHAQAFAQVLETWKRLGEVPPVYEHLWRRAQSAPPRPAAARGPAPRRRRTGWAAGAALALAASALILLAGPAVLIRWQADHVTQTAESRILRLEDGTVVEMGGDSAIATEMTASGRRVTLLAGEAFFDVAHDAARPFTVDAGGVAVMVLGTAFDVQMADGETTVELARGTVAISYAGADQRQNFELSPGEMAAVDLATGNVVRNTIAPEDIAAWRSGKMFVNDVTVGAAVERLQRYHPAWIRVVDPALALRRVTGVYDLNNPDRALEALVQPFGGRIRTVTAYGRILTRFLGRSFLSGQKDSRKNEDPVKKIRSRSSLVGRACWGNAPETETRVKMRLPTLRDRHGILTARRCRATGLHLLATTAFVGLSSLVLVPLKPAMAQDATARVGTARSFDIPSQPLSSALNAFGRQSGLQVTLAASTSRGVQSSAVSGSLDLQQALAQLLSGTGISYRISGGTAVIGAAASAGGGDTGTVAVAGTTVLDPISVFGAGGGGSLGAGEIQISAEELERKSPANIADVFAGEPGVSVGSSLPMSQKVYVHGIEETNLAVSIDGSRQNNKVFHHSGTNLIDPGLLKAVGVDAGVAPADAGPGALGGAIAYETKDARDLLDGEGIGGFAASSYNFNSNTVTTGLSAYGIHEGLEFLGYFSFGKGSDFTAGNGNEVEGTSTDILSGLGKLAYEFDSGDRVEISHERVHDDAPRPYRANTGFIDGRPPWEPRVRDYKLDRQNTVFTYTDSTPEGWWDPKLVLAYSSTQLEVPVFLRPDLNIPPYDVIGTTESFNGKFENKFSFDIGNIVAGIDAYSDRAELEDLFEDAAEKSRNLGVYAQARIEPWDRTRLSFGARGDTQEFTGTTGEDWTHSGFSGNVSGEYDLIEDLLTAKAGYSHVWAGVPLAENFIMNPAWDYGNGPDPVTADNYNLGLEATYNGFTIEGSIFQTDLNDARAPRYAVARGIEAHDVRSRGFEIGGGYDWGDGSFKVKYANIDVEIDGEPADSDLGTYLAAPAGQIVTLTAIHTFADYGVTVGADAEIALDYDDVAAGSEPYEGYEVFNAFVEYKPPTRPNLTFRAELKNIFDETYSDRATYGQEFGTVTPLYEPGRSFILTAKATF